MALPSVGPTTLQRHGFWSVPHWKHTRGNGKKNILAVFASSLYDDSLVRCGGVLNGPACRDLDIYLARL